MQVDGWAAGGVGGTDVLLRPAPRVPSPCPRTTFSVLVLTVSECGRQDDRRIAGTPSAGTALRAPHRSGAAIVGLARLFLGNHGNSGVSSSLASFGQAPGIAPPAYAYLDNPSVTLYLGQLEGGIAKSAQLTQGKSAGVSAGGLSLGGTTGSSSQAERVVNLTATARFYQLLDLPGKDGYLHMVNEAGRQPRSGQRASEKRWTCYGGCFGQCASHVATARLLKEDEPAAPARLPAGKYPGASAGAGERNVKLLQNAIDLAPRDAKVAGRGDGGPQPVLSIKSRGWEAAAPSPALHFSGGKDEPAASDRLPRLKRDLYRMACEGEVELLRVRPTLDPSQRAKPPC